MKRSLNFKVEAHATTHVKNFRAEAYATTRVQILKLRRITAAFALNLKIDRRSRGILDWSIRKAASIGFFAMPRVEILEQI